MSELWQHLLVVVGVALGILSAVRLFHERRPPATVFAWLFLIVLVPYLGLFLYWTFGGRRLLRKPGDSGVELPPEPPRRTPGNEVEILDTPEIAYETMLEVIRAARHSIHLEVFIISPDEMGTRIVDELTRRAADGLDVRVLVDAFGSLRARFGLLRRIRRAGGRIGIFHPFLPWARNWSVNIRNHRKLLVADGEVALTGGMNIGSEYLGPDDGSERWIDLGLRVRGPVVASMQHLFAVDWNYATGTLVETRSDSGSGGDADLELVTSAPTDEQQRLEENLVFSLARARSSVTIVTPYFIPDEVLISILAGLPQRGIQLRMILPARSNHPLADLARARHLRRLLPRGVGILLHPRMIHAKALVIDDALAFVGSPNLDLRSLYLNFESGLLMRTPTQIRHIRDWMDALARDSAPIDSRPPSGARALAESVAFFASPLL